MAHSERYQASTDELTINRDPTHSPCHREKNGRGWSNNMKLWLLENETVTGYETYDSAVVAAPDEATARMTHPSEYRDEWDGKMEPVFTVWCAAKDVIVRYIGEAEPSLKAGVVCASFNAG